MDRRDIGKLTEEATKLTEENEDKLRDDKNKLLNSIIGLIVYSLAITLGFIWFGWKLMTVLFLFVWGNNIGLYMSYIRPLQKQIKILIKK